MSLNIVNKIKNKKNNFLFITLVVFCLFSQVVTIELSFGITIDLASIGYILILMIFGAKKAIIVATICSVYRIGFLDTKIIEIIKLLEMYFLIYLFNKHKNASVMICDVIYWAIIGVPSTCLIYYFTIENANYYSGYFYFQLVFLVVNCIFNAFFSEIICTYVLRKTVQNKKVIVTFKHIFLHFLTIAILLPFITNILIGIIKTNNNISSNVDIYAQEVFEYTADSINKMTDDEKVNLQLSAVIETGLIKEKIKMYSKYKPFNINIIGDRGNEILSVDIKSKTIENINEYEKREVYNEYLYKMIPKNSNSKIINTRWIDGFFIYFREINGTNFSVSIEVPIETYKDSIMVEYISQFKFLLFFIVFISLIAMLLNRMIFNDLSRISVNTSNISDLLNNNVIIEWPSSNIVEIKYLVDNIKTMADELRFNFKEMKKSEKKLYELAYYDTLTTLPNRLHFKNILNNYIKLEEANFKIGIIFLDLNRFKVINDTLGHDVGDKLLVQVAKRLREIENDKIDIFRLGGDEFVVVVKIDNKEDLITCGELINQQFEENFKLDDIVLSITCSMGGSVYPDDSDEINNIIQYADIAMYKSKESYEGKLQLFNDEIKEIVYQKLTIEKEIFNAIEKNEFKVYYQPKFDAKSGDVQSVEALIRWDSNNLGVVPPEKFIPIAEESDLILTIDKWVLTEVCMQNKKLQDEGYKKVPISINISAKHFTSGKIKELVLDALKESGLEAKYLIIEITEGVLIKKVEEVQQIIKQLNEIGVFVSIDDFGKGYSSFSQLMNLPINEIKIDKVFITDIEKEYKKLNIVKSMVQLAHRLGLNVVAEGIENEEQKRSVIELGCDELQGFYYTKPIKIDTLRTFLEYRR